MDTITLVAPVLARQLAHQFHHDQTRKDGTTPYISHLERVAGRFIGKDKEAEAVAWLHDWDKTALTLTHLKQLYPSPEERAIVDALTLLAKPKYERYMDYICRVVENPLARKVKIADILDNLGDCPSSRQVEKYLKALPILLQSPSN